MRQRKFGSYTKEFQLLVDALPMLVSVTKNPINETDEQFISTHDRFITLDEVSKDKMAAPETAIAIQNIGKIYNLSLVQVSDIARAIRSHYFGELKLEDMPAILAREIPIDLEKAKQITQVVVKNIIQSSIGAQAVNYENLPLSQALQKYPALGEKLISGNPIKIKFLPAPVRPSIKNWITDYHQILGAGRHEMMDRGNYLYHSENARRLTPGERQKLAAALKALDENEAVTVDTVRQEIIFSQQVASSAGQEEEQPEKQDEKEEPQVTSHKPETPGNFRFSSPQRLPAEKEDSHYRPYRISPISYGEPKKDSQSGDGKPEPKVEGNVVDLRNLP